MSSSSKSSNPKVTLGILSDRSVLFTPLAPHSSTLAWKLPWMGGAWWAAVHGVAKSRTRLSGFTFTFHFHALDKEMATHSGVLAWRIPGTGKPGGLPSMGSHRVGHDWSDLAVAAESVCPYSLVLCLFTIYLGMQFPLWSRYCIRQRTWSGEPRSTG